MFAVWNVACILYIFKKYTQVRPAKMISRKPFDRLGWSYWCEGSKFRGSGGRAGQTGTNMVMWVVFMVCDLASFPGWRTRKQISRGSEGKLRRGAVILRIFRERECVANGLKLLVPYFKFVLNIMIVCVCSARVQLQSTALLSCCNNVLCALEVFPLPLWKAYSAIPSGFVLPLMYVWVWVKIRYTKNWMVNTKLD